MPAGGTQDRAGVALVPCKSCTGNVRKKVRLDMDYKNATHLPGVEEPVIEQQEQTMTLFQADIGQQKVKPRIVVVEQVIHQEPNKQPVGVSAGSFARTLETDEQVFVRKGKATEEWQPLEMGWIKPDGCAMLILKNEGESVIEMGIDISVVGSGAVLADWLVPPGETHRGTPALDLRLLRVRCRNGLAAFTLTLIPN